MEIIIYIIILYVIKYDLFTHTALLKLKQIWDSTVS